MKTSRSFRRLRLALSGLLVTCLLGLKATRHMQLWPDPDGSVTSVLAVALVVLALIVFTMWARDWP